MSGDWISIGTPPCARTFAVSVASWVMAMARTVEARFDDDHAVANAGLVLVATLADRLGIAAAADRLIRSGTSHPIAATLAGCMSMSRTGEKGQASHGVARSEMLRTTI